MPPSRHVTLKEVARQAGVSYQTVSKLLNGQVRLLPETEARIREAVESLGYRPLYPARSLRSRTSRTLGYSWTPSSPDSPNQILDLLLQSMLSAAETSDYHLLCFAHHLDLQRELDTYLTLYETRRVDGFILSSVEYDDPRIPFLLEREIPFVAFGRSNPGLQFPCIDVDGCEGLRRVVHHFLELGHRRIAVLAWPESSRVGNNRLEGYLQAMRSAGLEPDPLWIQRGEGQVAFGEEAALRLLNLPPERRPTAIAALNDLMAIGALRAAQQSGLRVGWDVAIAGFDDTPAARYVHPPLTSVRQPIWQIGQQLIAMLLNVLNHAYPPSPECILLAPELIIRASTSPDTSEWFDPSHRNDEETKNAIA